MRLAPCLHYLPKTKEGPGVFWDKMFEQALRCKAMANEEKLTTEFSLHPLKEHIVSTQMFMKVVEYMQIRDKHLTDRFHSRFHCTFNNTK